MPDRAVTMPLPDVRSGPAGTTRLTARPANAEVLARTTVSAMVTDGSDQRQDSAGAASAPRAVAELLAESDRRDRALQDALWRYAWRTAQRDAYETGFYDGCMSLKKAQHDAVELTELEVARWGPGGREHFADPRPGDRTEAPVRLPSAGVWLGGPPVHRHICSAPCFAYAPGWYSTDDAAKILRALPGSSALGGAA